MIHPPRLMITYNSNKFPVSAKCSVCGQEMPKGDMRRTFIGEDLCWFKAQFEAHKKTRHPR